MYLKKTVRNIPLRADANCVFGINKELKQELQAVG